VLEAAVIGLPDEKWGERPEKFVVLPAGAQVSEGDLIAHRRARIARCTSPKAVEFVAALPKTSTGKVRRFELREKEWAGHVSRIQG
jgi:fatty-acyl-CoA synthase